MFWIFRVFLLRNLSLNCQAICFFRLLKDHGLAIVHELGHFKARKEYDKHENQAMGTTQRKTKSYWGWKHTMEIQTDTLKGFVKSIVTECMWVEPLGLLFYNLISRCMSLSKLIVKEKGSLCWYACYLFLLLTKGYAFKGKSPGNMDTPDADRNSFASQITQTPSINR